MSAIVVWVTAAVLAAVAGWALLVPHRKAKLSAASASGHDGAEQVTEQRRLLLRQLRDLDEDHAAGKLDDAAYLRLREPVVAQAAASLGTRPASTARPVRGRGGNRPAGRRARVTRTGPVRRRHGRTRVLAAVAAVVTIAGAVAALLGASVSARGPGQTLSGDAPATADAAATRDRAPKADTADPADLSALEQRVRADPHDLNALLRLAAADLAAGRARDAGTAYLAVLGQQPDNPAAGTGLALLLFRAGRISDAEAAVSHVIRTRPGYPDAYYARGLIELMARHQPALAQRDLRRYLSAAPHGPRAPTAQALLQLTAGGTGK